METSTEIPEDLKKNYSFDGKTYTYTDKGKVFVWNLSTNAWVEKTEKDDATTSTGIINRKPEKRKRNPDEEYDTDDDDQNDDDVQKTTTQPNTQDMSKGVYGFEDGFQTYTDNDGIKYFFDREKNGWFPKIDDTFIAYYQMNYGCTPSNTTAETPDESKPVAENVDLPEKPTPAVKKKAEDEPPKWFDVDEAHNTKVYVSNLPLDTTETEFVDLMQKCGLVVKDLKTNKMKIKLYQDPESKLFKGDALCTYIKKESVDLALNILDGYDFRDHKIKVERAKFTMKGDSYDAKLKPKKKRRKDIEKEKKNTEKLFAWQPDQVRGVRGKHECVVVIKNLFDPLIFDEDLGLKLEYQEDIAEECRKCGKVKKVVIHDQHKDGVAQVFFAEPEAADVCVQMLNKRWFSQRMLEVEKWDGKTKYKIEETKEEENARLAKWANYLEAKESEQKRQEAAATAPSNSTTALAPSVEEDAPSNSTTASAPSVEEDNSEAESSSKKNLDGGSNNVIDDDDGSSDGTRSSAGSGDETDEESASSTTKKTLSS